MAATPLPAFLTSPGFWIGFLRSAVVATEKAAPNYTIAHHVGAVMGAVLGLPTTSTPTAKDAEPLLPAIGEAFSQVFLGALAASAPVSIPAP